MDETETPTGLEGFITEITSLKEVETALRASETRYRLLAERSQDIISQHDLEGCYQYVSPACQPLLGYTVEEMLGKPLQDFLHPDDHSLVTQHYWQFLREHSVQKLRFRLRDRS